MTYEPYRPLPRRDRDHIAPWKGRELGSAALFSTSCWHYARQTVAFYTAATPRLQQAVVAMWCLKHRGWGPNWRCGVGEGRGGAFFKGGGGRPTSPSDTTAPSRISNFTFLLKLPCVRYTTAPSRISNFTFFVETPPCALYRTPVTRHVTTLLLLSLCR